MQSNKEADISEVKKIEKLYDSKLAKTKKLQDDLARDKAKLQLEASKYKNEANDWQAKYHKREKDIKTAEKKVIELQAEIGNCNAKINDADNNRKHAEGNVVRLHGDIAALERRIAALKKQLEEETLLRVDLENRIQSIKEELAFKDKLHEQELNEIKTQTTTTHGENDSGFCKESETKLQDALKAIRKEQDKKMRMFREEVETLYDRKNVANKLYIRDLEYKLQHEKKLYEQRLQQNNIEITTLHRAPSSDETQEYVDLDVNLRLSSEIEVYKKLLEAGEGMLQGRTPMTGRKRKRVTIATTEQFGSQAAYDYASEALAKGAIKIHDTNHEGKYIKLHNIGTENIVLGGWHLTHVAGDKETKYKFHRNLTLKAGQFTTVWSFNAGQTHKPPTDLVMKEQQQWFIADEMKTSLFHEDQEMATREMKRKVQQVSRTSRT